MNSLDIGKHINQLLRSNEQLASKVHNQIYPVVSEQDAKFPFIIYRRNGIQVNTVKCGIVNEDIQMQILVISDKYSDSVEIAKMVVETLSTDDNTILNNADESYISNGDSFVQTLNFKINNEYGN